MGLRVRRLIFLLKVLAVLLVAAGGIALVFYLPFLLGRVIPAGEDIYLRDVYLLVDQTRSLNEQERQAVKELVTREILPAAGVGDRIFCYRIGSRFDEIADRVFVSPRGIPKLPANVLDYPLKRFKPEVHQGLRESWQRFETEREKWHQALAALEPQDGRYSDYLGTLNVIGQRFNDQDDRNQAREQWLIMIGDLKHDSRDSRSLSQVQPSTSQEKRRFKQATVFLVYPGGTNTSQEQQELEIFWRRYFQNRGNRRIQIVSFDKFIGRFPKSPAPPVADLATSTSDT